MQCDCLVIADVAPAFAFAREKLGVETPRYDRVDDHVVIAVNIELLGNDEKLTISTVGACASISISITSRVGGEIRLPVESCFLGGIERQ